MTAAVCGIGACANSSTRPSSTTTTTLPASHPITQPVIVQKHEPVAPPPAMPAPIADATPSAHPPTTQPTAPTTPALVAATQPGPIDDRVAYAIGYSAGRRIHDRLSQDGRSADDLQVMKGVIDGLSDRDPAYPREAVLEAFADFQAYTQQRRAEKLYADNPSFRKHADENLQKSRALLNQNAEMAGVEVEPDGVQMQVLSPGNGRVVGNAKMLTVKNLSVSLADGTLVKCSQVDQTEKINVSDALPALVDAMRGLKVGGKYKIWLPPDKAYGLTGKSPVIGPNQAIEFEFELINAE